MPTESEEVAEDYRQALEDLSSNARFEISNLTVIARENTEHALLIAEALEKHILKTAPSKKLPALYVLDSIVKNVGTPYTLYLGRNLFKTFMEAYTVVDNPTRKRMEEMLKTWKQPVAGSMDTRPVFSPDLVRPIENALMKAKAAMMPQAQLPGRTRPVMPPHRDTPTPPGMRSHGGTPSNFTPQPLPYPYGPHPGEPHANGQPVHPHQSQPYYQNSTPQPPNSAQLPFQPPMPGAYGMPGAQSHQARAGVNVETLNNDIQNISVAMRAEAALKPHDAGVQSKLKALLDLQRIVQTQSLPQDQLELIKNEVTKLAGVTVGTQPSMPIPITNTTPQAQLPFVPPQSQPARRSVTPTQAPPSTGQGAVTLDSLLGAGALAALMRKTPSQNSTPNPPPSAAIRSPPPATASPFGAAPSASKPLSLMEQLRQAGMLPSSTPTNTTAASTPQPPSMPIIPSNIADILASSKAQAAALNIPGGGLNALSLKHPARPEVISQLYDQLGPPCSQCGRRFKTDEEGRKKKTAHMDWHFRVHQRGNDADKRGTHRSWYIDTQEWVKSRESVDADHIHSSEDSATQASKAAAEAAKPKYIRVPDASSGINNVCPICQDKFENRYLDTAQEWVWMDAILVGGRAYHASCHAEATRDREGTPRRTPEPSILGKRKAEMGLASPKVRSLKTSA